jgi:hypothetical protein
LVDIFISYKKEDRGTIERLATALETQGFDVWWDSDLVAGSEWDETIAAKLSGARCVIVAWSPRAAKSKWVKDEARLADSLNKLVPIVLEPMSLPLGFGSVQAEDFSGWNGEADSPQFTRLCSAIRAKLEGREAPPQETPYAAAKARTGILASRVGRIGAAAGVVLFSAAIAAYLWMPRGPAVDLLTWAETAPNTGWCYQTDNLIPRTDQFMLSCHKTQDACETARGDSRRRKTACVLTTDLHKLPSWTRGVGQGTVGSWRAFSETLHQPPAPQFQ